MKTTQILIPTLLFLMLALSACDLIGFRTNASWQEKAIEGQSPELCLEATHPDTCLHSYIAATNDKHACTYMSSSEKVIACNKG